MLNKNNIKVIAWDFDGVLNRNIIDGRFIWADHFEQDIGQSVDTFNQHIFAQNLIAIMTGQEDLRDRIQNWTQMVGYTHSPDTILDYWFVNDVHPDPFTIGLMDRLNEKGVRQVITTNNETRRAAFIESTMGFAPRIEQMFASGRMGMAKPDPAYFQAVTTALNVAPSEILLVDDTLENTKAAASMGWHTMHFTDDTRHSLEDILPI